MNSLTSSPTVFSLANLIQLHWPFLEYARHTPTSGSLHLLLTPPGNFLPQISTMVILSLPSSFCSNIDQISPF